MQKCYNQGMDRKSKILLWSMVVLVVLSVSATFYKTVILQAFDVTGVWIEFPTEDSSYVFFIYENEEYELELDTTDYDELVLNVAHAINAPENELTSEFFEYFEVAYEEALNLKENNVINTDSGPTEDSYYE